MKIIDSLPIYQQTFTIPAIECDFRQEWKPSYLYQHLTQAAGVHADLLGVGYDGMSARGLFWVHSRMKVQFQRFPHAGETVTLRTWPKTIQRKLLYIRDFEVLDPSGKRVACATSAWLIVNASTHRLASPRLVTIDVPHITDLVGLDDPLESIEQAAGGEERLRLRAGYSSIDLLGHVNNVRYVEWICDAFPLETYQTQRLDWFQINYLHEILPGEEVSLRVNPVPSQPGLWAVEGYHSTADTRFFVALVQWK